MGIDRHGGQGRSANSNAEGPRACRVEAVFVLAGAKRRARLGRPRAIHIYEQRGETQMCTPLLSRHRSCRVMSDMTRSAPPLIQRADAMFRPRPIGTTVIVCLKLGFPVACLAIRGSDTAAGLTAGLSARTGRRHRAARSLRCARPSDLHPDGRIAGFLARMRATPPVGSVGRPPPGYAIQHVQRPHVPGRGRHGRNLRARCRRCNRRQGPVMTETR